MRLITVVYSCLIAIGLIALAACTDNNPPVQKETSVPTLTGRVVDNANLLSSIDKRSLIDKLATIDKESKVEIVVLTVPKLENTSIEEFSNKTFNVWKIGKKGTDSGLLIVLSLDPRKFRVEVGRGNEGAIPDMVANRIMQDEMRPYLAKKEFYSAFNAGIDALNKKIQENK